MHRVVVFLVELLPIRRGQPTRATAAFSQRKMLSDVQPCGAPFGWISVGAVYHTRSALAFEELPDVNPEALAQPR